jgi:hypothetical protein
MLNMKSTHLLVFGLSFGCAELKVDIDADEDGLLGSQEEALNTDPDVADSDGDGHLDGVEYEGGFDPLDPESHPYFGDYPTKPCDPFPEATGYAIGDTSQDFALVDQYGEEVTLSDFCGKTVVLETSAFW